MSLSYEPKDPVLSLDAKANKLLWDTDTDWNKGTLGVDTEVVDSGASAKIAPKNTPIHGTDIYLSWHLNESSGTTAADSSQYNRPGTLVTGEGYNPSQWVAGKLNNGLSNPGEYESANYISGGDIAAFEYDDPFSIECWFNLTPGYDVSLAGNFSSVDGKGWTLFLQEGWLRLDLRSSENFIQAYSDLQATGSVWQHLVVTYDGSGVAAGVKFYLDGTLLGTSAYSDNLSSNSIVPATNNFRVGAVLDTGWGWIGQVDEFNLYTVVLSQADVTFRYNGGDGTETPCFTQAVYAISAHYETNIYDSGLYDNLWRDLAIIQSAPSGTTVEVKARASNSQSSMGSFGVVLTDGQLLNLVGRYIQFSVDFTGTTTERASVNSISDIFYAPVVTVVSP